MPKRELSERQELQKTHERDMMVYKANDMIQKGRHRLSLKEQKAVVYVISKIKPDDTALTEYSFELADFYTVCGIDKESYTEIKSTLLDLKSKCWWMEVDDKGTESAVCWFNTVRTNRRSGKVTVKLHEDMMPFLLELARSGKLYTKYELRYILPMKSNYGIKLYEILKSYSNNPFWWFEVSKLKKLLDAEKYSNFADFRRFVLKPALNDINEFSDLTVSYRAEKEGKSYSRIEFFMDIKQDDQLLCTRLKGEKALD